MRCRRRVERGPLPPERNGTLTFSPVPSIRPLGGPVRRQLVVALCVLTLLTTPAVHVAAAEDRPAETKEKIAAIAAELRIDGISNDPSYGYTPDNPLAIGGIDLRTTGSAAASETALRMAAFFSLATSLKSRPFRWQRERSCCPIKASTAFQGTGFIDIYVVGEEGERPFRIFVNHYESGPLQAPVGMVPFSSIGERDAFWAATDHFESRDFAAAADAFRPLADNGSIMATFSLGLALLSGGERKDEAHHYFRRAAEMGHSGAQFFAGAALRRGVDVRKDWETGTAWLRTAAANGSAEAREKLALDLIRGHQTAEDPSEAALLLWLAAEQGQADAQVAFGEALITGRGIRQNVPWGTVWLAIAKAAGHPLAAEFYHSATSRLSRDIRDAIEKRAADWRQKVRPSEVAIRAQFGAQAGDPAAQFEMGRMLYNGVLMSRDIEASLMFLVLASRNGNADAKLMLDEMPNVTPEAMARAQVAADAWSDKQE